MGMMMRIFEAFFGAGTSELRQTVEVFRENAEAAAQRGQHMQEAALTQFAQEFVRERRGLFDRAIDGLNRLPRPGLALGTLALFVAAMVDPLWFAARMQGIALVPEPLWWLLGVIVSFYFGARHQAKGQAFQLQMGQAMAQLPQVLRHLQQIEQHHETQTAKKMGSQAGENVHAYPPSEGDLQNNPALLAWHEAAGRAAPATM